MPKSSALVMNDFSTPKRIGSEVTPHFSSPCISVTSLIISRGVWTKREKMNGIMHRLFAPTMPPRTNDNPLTAAMRKFAAIVFLSIMPYKKSRAIATATIMKDNSPRLREKINARATNNRAHIMTTVPLTVPLTSGRCGLLILSISISLRSLMRLPNAHTMKATRQARRSRGVNMTDRPIHAPMKTDTKAMRQLMGRRIAT